MKRILALLIWFSTVNCNSQALINKYGYDYSFSENKLSITKDEDKYTISALSNDIVKVTYSGNSVYSDKIFAPALNNSAPLKINERNDTLIVSTGRMIVEVSFTPLRFSYYDINKVLKLKEEKGFMMNSDTTAFRFWLQHDEAIYGTGARALPNNRRGYKFQCYNQANYGYGVGADFLNYSVPVLMSSEKYMLLFDNPARAWFDIGKSNKDIMEFSSLGGNMVYYFINGDSYKDLLNKYSLLTGTQPLPPLWAFGNMQSRMGYETQEETEYIVEQMLANGYPLDAIIIDLYWFSKELQDGLMGNLTWDKTRWPDPNGMISGFNAKGVKTVTVSEPFFTRTSNHFKYLSENKLLGLDSAGNTMTMPYFYFGDAGLIDIFKHEAREWFWKQYKKEKERGIAGWWGDLGEPEVHPDNMVHVVGKASEVHGLYGHEWVGMLYEYYEKEYPQERLFKLGRAGYAGSQRYGLIPWSGDVGRTWSGLRAQIPVMLGTGLSGVPYMHSDAGGFASGQRDSLLYIRWLQFAVFSPIFRPHGDPNAPPEPIFYHEKVQNIIKETIMFRYRMLPYNYTLAWEALTTGMPLARPLFVEFENTNKLDTINTQYMWGDNILVAPILYPGAKERQVYLPEGEWTGLWSRKYYKGGQTVSVDVTMDNIPVFIKTGSALTLTKPMQNTNYYDGSTLEVHCFMHNGNNNFETKIYLDDGYLKGAYNKGKYELITVSVSGNEKTPEIDIKKDGAGYTGAPLKRVLEFSLYGFTEKPDSLLFNSELIGFNWNEENNTLYFNYELEKAD